ncbi:NAD(P)/FAD-dependent oxidoreductase [Dactylosporangium sp. NPDC051541]|uniref:NAD(P)/FAD-dependent oxidoreductase n=1 Tax=Dactylosporangium sp. NPDC051541 TaxID=3363977 RepID=UPI00379F721D
MTGGLRQAHGDRLRVVVVGAGITGLLAAVRCTQAGHRVVLVDRGAIPHPGSTSFDQHRALRALTVGDPAGTGAAMRLHRRWRELDALLSDRLSGALYRRVGVLTALLGPAAEAGALDTAEAVRLAIRIADPADFPHIGFPEGTAAAVFEPQAGVLLADRFLHAAGRWLRRQPLAELRPGRTVVDVRPDGGRVRLADGTAESGDAVLVAAGPWTARLLGLPVVLHRQSMVYLRPPAGLVNRWAATPVAGGIGTDGRAWLLPSVAGTLLKVSTDAVRHEVSDLADPSNQARWTARVLSSGAIRDIERYDVVRARQCHYATQADGGTGFVRVGPAVWARPASGGDGFRTAPLAVDAVASQLSPAAIS